MVSLRALSDDEKKKRGEQGPIIARGGRTGEKGKRSSLLSDPLPRKKGKGLSSHMPKGNEREKKKRKHRFSLSGAVLRGEG